MAWAALWKIVSSGATTASPVVNVAVAMVIEVVLLSVGPGR
jgi:hypothetical protein